MWYTYSMEYSLVIKKNEIMPFAETWMDLEIVILSEVNKKEKETDLQKELMVAGGQEEGFRKG